MKSFFTHSQDRTSLDPVQVFILLLCCASIVHFDYAQNWLSNSFTLPTWICAHLVLFFFCSAPGVLLLTALQWGLLWEYLPLSEHNWLVICFLNLSISAVCLREIFKNKSLTFEITDSFWQSITALVRWVVIVVYFFAAFHKYNTGFLDLEGSCGIHVYHAIRDTRFMFPIPEQPPEFIRWFLTYGALLFETLIFVFIALPRTWALGLLLGGSFHLFTSLVMPHFPVLMLSTYLLFLPRDVQKEVVDVAQNWTLRMSNNKFGLTNLIGIFTLTWSIWTWGVFALYRSLTIDFETNIQLTYIFIRCYSLTLFCLFTLLLYFLLKHQYLARSNKLPSSKIGLLGLIPLTLVLNSFSPYLGLRLNTSFGMYSNLITLGEHSNHLFMPKYALKFFPYADDLVELVASSNGEIELKYSSQNTIVPFIEFQRYVHSLTTKSKDAISIQFKRNGVFYDIKDAREEPLFTEQEHLCKEKFAHFPIFPKEGVRCRP